MTRKKRHIYFLKYNGGGRRMRVEMESTMFGGVSKLGPMLNKSRFTETKRKIPQNVRAKSDGVWQRDMADDGGRITETGESGENDDKIDVQSDIEGPTTQIGAGTRDVADRWTLPPCREFFNMLTGREIPHQPFKIPHQSLPFSPPVTLPFLYKIFAILLLNE